VKAVLLGGSGFIGAHLAQALVEAGTAVTVYDWRWPALAPQWPGVRYVLGDLLAAEPAGLAEALCDADLVYHLAWRFLPATANQQMLQDVQDNLLGAVRMLERCVAARVGRVIFFSSGGTIYGPAQTLPIPETHPTEPRTSHAINKLAVEKYLALFGQLHGLDYVILRPGNPFGPYQNPHSGQGVIAAFLARAAAGQPLEVWGDGNVVRDYFYVGDLARAAVLAGTTPHSRAVYNIGSGTGLSVRDLITAIHQLIGAELPVVWRPGRSVDVPANVLDISKARTRLGWAPDTSFAEALQRTWRYYLDLSRG
jgi:UDP-glucose 4-epimerase